ncbi:MAG: RHS repeat-associated core domain-containing protein [Saprospiraceae bacterium]|nr:RHS repeat-associated core domain-containing protein [Saprospiraceae bacterium]
MDNGLWIMDDYSIQKTGRLVFDDTNGTFEYHYDLKDHLGNVRLSFKANSQGNPTVMQQDHYYPFGMRLAGLSETSGGDNQYLYNGKELEDYNDLHWYHYGARYYDPQLGRWMQVDPADEFHNPFAYCGNNPILFVDPDGQATYRMAMPMGFGVHTFIAVIDEQDGSIQTRGLYPVSRGRAIERTAYQIGEFFKTGKFNKADNQSSQVIHNKPSEVAATEMVFNKIIGTSIAFKLQELKPPKGMSVEEHDALILDLADQYPTEDRPYNATNGYNCNTFTYWLGKESGSEVETYLPAIGETYEE